MAAIAREAEGAPFVAICLLDVHWVPRGPACTDGDILREKEEDNRCLHFRTDWTPGTGNYTYCGLFLQALDGKGKCRWCRAAERAARLPAGTHTKKAADTPPPRPRAQARKETARCHSTA